MIDRDLQDLLDKIQYSGANLLDNLPEDHKSIDSRLAEIDHLLYSARQMIFDIDSVATQARRVIPSIIRRGENDNISLGDLGL